MQGEGEEYTSWARRRCHQSLLPSLQSTPWGHGGKGACGRCEYWGGGGQEGSAEGKGTPGKRGRDNVERARQGSPALCADLLRICCGSAADLLGKALLPYVRADHLLLCAGSHTLPPLLLPAMYRRHTPLPACSPSSLHPPTLLPAGPSLPLPAMQLELCQRALGVSDQRRERPCDMPLQPVANFQIRPANRSRDRYGRGRRLCRCNHRWGRGRGQEARRW